MKKEIYTLLFLISVVTVKAQSFPQQNDNPLWKVGVRSFWAGTCEALHWKYGNNVMICGASYMEAVECDYANMNCQVKGYIRADNQNIYARKTTSCSETDRLMYSFGSTSGSDFTMAYNLGTYDTTRAMVTATQSIAYQNINRLTQFITYTVDPPANNYVNYMTAIEGIGNDIHPFFALTCFGDFCETDFQLMEYRENNVVLYSKNPTFPANCVGWVGVEETDRIKEFKIYPNPSVNFITIETDRDYREIHILNGLGQLLISQPKTTEKEIINLSALAPGIYFVEVRMEDTDLVVRKKIVKE